MKITFDGAELAVLFEAIRGDGTKPYPVERIKMAGEIAEKLSKGLEARKEKRKDPKTGKEEDIQNIYFVSKQMDFSIPELTFIKEEFDKVKEWSIQRAPVIEPLKVKLENPEPDKEGKKKEDAKEEDKKEGEAEKK